ncbi:expressed unknown protein [Seminavis robusta]|uniref:Uncharacterized protein n=1 Tax=Seminavis robusta TaxID=568900 RepID=A0A9N8D7M3_9STRA|nr:expressed unknown protein [Seminavis robusta]|eukprot:Sro22_g015190.1 n/a (455) ;mRNA; f:34015-35379
MSSASAKGSILVTYWCLCFQCLHCLALVSALENDRIPPAPPGLSGLCSRGNLSTLEGLAQCDLACAFADCCWRTSSPAITSCNASNPLCDDYLVCSILDPANATITHSPVPWAPITLNDDCLRNGENLTACEDACRLAECCWKTGTCLREQTEVCNDYVSCAVLLGQDSQAPTNHSADPSIPIAPEALEDYCTVGAIEGDIGSSGVSRCEDFCARAECCWKTDSCLASQAVKCQGYVFCGILSLNETTSSPPLPEAASYLADVCAPHIVANVEGAVLCADACRRGECCWKTMTCLGVHAEQCPGYEPCKALSESDNDVGGMLPVPTNQPSSTGDVADYTEALINDACLNHDNSVVNVCSRVCEGSECCFHPDNLDGTYCGDFPCYKYSACLVLYPLADDAVNQACTSDNLSDCARVCGTSTCCFTQDSEKVCAVTNPGIVCSLFAACGRLYVSP